MQVCACVCVCVAIGRLMYVLCIVLLSWGLYIMRVTGREQWFGVA